MPRTYQLYVPAAYDGSRPVPVVFDFHGYGSNALQQMGYGDFRPLADRDDFIIVAPDGQDRGGRHFNLAGEPGLQNDIQMVGALLDRIETQFCVDTLRVYSTGMSDGGAMSSVLACLSADRFAAFAPVAVVLYPMVCNNTRRLAFEGFSGTADPVVPFEGGAVRCCGMPVLGAPSDAMSMWAAHNGYVGGTQRLRPQLRRGTSRHRGPSPHVEQLQGRQRRRVLHHRRRRPHVAGLGVLAPATRADHETDQRLADDLGLLQAEPLAITAALRNPVISG
jgi:poly(3-hydroxybutyrate) depolymerase